ncbi:uncharacterized protein [Triticum aestivum]|uniref:uncharacterized protein n=1 Tax=Triticum aestivum TaxID=4565 RepID=UPI001D005F77|nr:uncharacterized protein LOC123134224 [Triticum aestivum]
MELQVRRRPDPPRWFRIRPAVRRRRRSRVVVSSQLLARQERRRWRARLPFSGNDATIRWFDAALPREDRACRGSSTPTMGTKPWSSSRRTSDAWLAALSSPRTQGFCCFGSLPP